MPGQRGQGEPAPAGARDDAAIVPAPPAHASQLDASRSFLLQELSEAETKLEHALRESALLGDELETLRATRGVRAMRLLAAPKAGWRDWAALPAALYAVLRSPASPQVAAPPATVEKRPPPAQPSTESSGGPGSLRIAAIVDGFTARGLAPDCQLCLLSADDALSELERFRPDLLLVESAWEGNDGHWHDRLVPPGRDLVEILAWCGREGVPTVFWSKEDPPHFDHFLPLALHFDWIFTTAAESVPHYRERLRREAVGVLPFACQPRMHNPLESEERRTACCFAGSYYEDYPERGADFESLVAQVQSHMPVHVYDRNHGSGRPEFAFPERFQPLITGGLPGERVVEAYKRYRFAINVNSITRSRTMFARRVFELLACNTVTVSNQTLGMQRLFGDLVLVDGPGLPAQLETLLADPVRYRKFRLAGLRKVMSEHTWRNRLDALAQQVLGRVGRTASSPVTVLALAQSAEDVGRLVAAFERQAHPARELVLVAEPAHRPASGLPVGVRWLSPQEARGLRPAEAFAGRLLATFVPEDYYGPNYLTDLVLGFRYADTDVVGKAASYRWQDGRAILQGEGEAYRPAAALPVRASLLRPAQVPADLLDWLEAAGQAVRPGTALDEFGYCRHGAGRDVAGVVDDVSGLDAGLDLPAFVADDSSPSLEKSE